MEVCVEVGAHLCVYIDYLLYREQDFILFGSW